MSERFNEASRALSDRLYKAVYKLPNELKAKVQEIRVRAEKPLALSVGNDTLFVDNKFTLSENYENSLVASMEDIVTTFQNICCYSVYSHQNEIKNGFVTMGSGHRVGICGTAVSIHGEINSVRDISSLNIRIAREIPNASEELLRRVGKLDGGLLIVGMPCSGKTTILRDLARRISLGIDCRIMRTSVVDERSELSGTYAGISKNDLGLADILNGYSKADGIMQALRTLSPEAIICDEIGASSDMQAIEQGVNAGVSIIATIHAESYHELLSRNQGKALIGTGAFKMIVILDSRENVGKIKELIRLRGAK